MNSHSNSTHSYYMQAIKAYAMTDLCVFPISMVSFALLIVNEDMGIELRPYKMIIIMLLGLVTSIFNVFVFPRERDDAYPVCVYLQAVAMYILALSVAGKAISLVSILLYASVVLTSRRHIGFAGLVFLILAILALCAPTELKQPWLTISVWIAFAHLIEKDETPQTAF